MKNRWIEKFTGILTIKITGQGLERFFNKIVNNGIIVWDVQRHSDTIITFKMRLNDVSKLRQLRRGTNCKISFIKRDGLPFLVNKLLRNSGILFGALLFTIIIFILSNMIWKIDIEGASPQVEQKLFSQLTKLGVSVGKFQFFVDDVESIQRKLTYEIDEVTWIGVELNGTAYKFTVVEKEQPEPKEISGPQNIVAKKKAHIVDMFIEEGKIEVNINDYVQKGQLLVSGTIGMEGEEKFVSARGQVYGETWYKTDVNLPLQLITDSLTGNYKNIHYIKIARLKIPIYQFWKKDLSNYEIDETEHRLYFIGRALPISYVKKVLREKVETSRQYTEEEAVTIARQIARKQLLNKLDDDVKIKGEKVLQESIDNGKVNLKIHFQVIENIGTTQPIIQGD